MSSLRPFNARIHNNRKKTRGRNIQIVYSEPQYVITGTKVIMIFRKATDNHEWVEKVIKNTYRLNPNARPIKSIRHAA